jgi:hypothetical protein
MNEPEQRNEGNMKKLDKILDGGNKEANRKRKWFIGGLF